MLDIGLSESSAKSVSSDILIHPLAATRKDYGGTTQEDFDHALNNLMHLSQLLRQMHVLFTPPPTLDKEGKHNNNASIG